MDKVQVGIIGCGNILPAYVKGCRSFEILDLTACADIEPERAQARAAEFGIRALLRGRLAGRSGHRPGHQSDRPGGARGRQSGGYRSRQARSLRKAARGDTDGRRTYPGCGRERRACGGLCARHLPGRRPADLPQADRRRGHRRAGGRHGLHARPRPGVLASEPRVLLQDRRRPDVRHGPVLPDSPGAPAGSGPPRDGLGAHLLPGARRDQPGALRATHHRGGADPPRLRSGFRIRAGRHAHHQLRRLEPQPAAHRNLRLGRLAERARSQHLRRTGQNPPGRSRRLDGSAADPQHGRGPRHRSGRHGLRVAVRVAPIAPAATWPSTCWT